MIFLHCVLMFKMIIDMSPIPSFSYIKWNEIQIENLKFVKMDYVMSFLFHINALPLDNLMLLLFCVA
jgi:hypothetical protein